MKGFNKRVFEMLGRLAVFAKAHPQFFGIGTLAGLAMAEIEAAVENLTEHDTSLEGGDAKVRMSAGDRLKARRTLRDCLETIARTANGLKIELFSMPRGRSDGTMVSVGRSWAVHLEAFKQMFIDSGMPMDFIEKLNAAIKDVQRAISEQEFSKGARLKAATAIADTRSNALSALHRLDPIMDNLLRDNPPDFAVWQRARRVERYNAAKPVDTADPSPPVHT